MTPKGQRSTKHFRCQASYYGFLDTKNVVLTFDLLRLSKTVIPFFHWAFNLFAANRRNLHIQLAAKDCGWLSTLDCLNANIVMSLESTVCIYHYFDSVISLILAQVFF